MVLDDGASPNENGSRSESHAGISISGVETADVLCSVLLCFFLSMSRVLFAAGDLVVLSSLVADDPRGKIEAFREF